MLVILGVSPAINLPAGDGAHGVIGSRANADNPALDVAQKGVMGRSQAGRRGAQPKLDERVVVYEQG